MKKIRAKKPHQWWILATIPVVDEQGKTYLPYFGSKARDNLITIHLCHYLIQEQITFDAEYGIRFPVEHNEGIDESVMEMEDTDIVPLNTPGRKRKLRRAKRKLSRGKRKRGCRFDVVIVKDNKIVGIIETKANYHGETSPQIERYKEFGVPVFFCRNMGEVPKAVQFAKKVFGITTAVSNILEP
jgi:hypothetical protein